MRLVYTFVQQHWRRMKLPVWFVISRDISYIIYIARLKTLELALEEQQQTRAGTSPQPALTVPQPEPLKEATGT